MPAPGDRALTDFWERHATRHQRRQEVCYFLDSDDSGSAADLEASYGALHGGCAGVGSALSVQVPPSDQAVSEPATKRQRAGPAAQLGHGPGPRDGEAASDDDAVLRAASPPPQVAAPDEGARHGAGAGAQQHAVAEQTAAPQLHGDDPEAQVGRGPQSAAPAEAAASTALERPADVPGPSPGLRGGPASPRGAEAGPLMGDAALTDGRPRRHRRTCPGSDTSEEFDPCRPALLVGAAPTGVGLGRVAAAEAILSGPCGPAAEHAGGKG